MTLRGGSQRLDINILCTIWEFFRVSARNSDLKKDLSSHEITNGLPVPLLSMVLKKIWKFWVMNPPTMSEPWQPAAARDGSFDVFNQSVESSCYSVCTVWSKWIQQWFIYLSLAGKIHPVDLSHCQNVWLQHQNLGKLILRIVIHYCWIYICQKNATNIWIQNSLQ